MMDWIPGGMSILEFCQANGLRILAGHAFQFFLENLRDLPGNYLEIGVFEGVMLRELATRFPEKMFYGIDPFIEDGHTIGHNICTEKGQRTVAQEEISERNIEGLPNVKLFKQTSRSWAEEITDKLIDKMDIGSVFIDGDHSYEEAANDFALAERLLINGGIIYADDVGLPGVGQALKEFIERHADIIIDYDGCGFIRLKKQWVT